MKKVCLYVVLFVSVSSTFAQTCIVSIDTLKGSYSGGCNKGRAEGCGTAAGIDSYTGNFKKGYPDGKGKYIWKNGNWYEGLWKRWII